MAFRPGWKFYHDLGRNYSDVLEPVMTWREIGAELGCSHQRAYHEAQVALGKLIYGIKKSGIKI